MDPPTVSTVKKNPAADPRQLRRIIAEDPEWNLETVAPLTEICVKHIVGNFKESPILDELKPKHRSLVLAGLATDLPLNVTGHLVHDEEYWKRCCKARWKLCDVKRHGGVWKRMYFERNLQEAIEGHAPVNQEEVPKELLELMKISSSFVECLEIRQQLPQPVDQAVSAEDEDGDVLPDVDAKASCDHLNMAHVLPHLHCLKELSITYGVRDCGMNFEWSLFEFTRNDCTNLSKAIKASKVLTTMRLHRSQVDDVKGRVLVSHLLDHPTLTTLDLSHNCMSDGAGRALGKLLNGHCCLKCLDVSDNDIGRDGGFAIGHALEGNTTLKTLNLRLNKLGDDGVRQILKSLLKNTTLTSLNLSANNLGEASAQSLSEVFVGNKTLTVLDLSSNGFGEVAGRILQEAMEENGSLTTLDLRLTEISQQSEYSINQAIAANQERAKAAAATATT